MTMIFGHRGTPKLCPENSMSSFINAYKVGAHGIEMDVHMLPDGSMVIHHDEFLGRCEKVHGSIYDFNAQTIRSFSIGEFFSPQFTDERVPFFEELLEFLKDKDMLLNVEIKSDSGFLCDAADRTVELLTQYGMEQKSIISSFDHNIIREVKTKHPQFKVGMLYEKPLPSGGDVVQYCLKYGFDAIHPDYRFVTKELVDRCHQNGINVNVWTVDEQKDVNFMKECGVDIIISNKPDEVLKM